MSEKETTTVTVVDQEQYDSGPFDFGNDYEDGTLSKVIDSLLALREAVPAEYRATARCEIGSGSYYDSQYATIRIAYERPATESEIAGRLAEERAREQQRVAAEKATYARLKARYGTDK